MLEFAALLFLMVKPYLLLIILALMGFAVWFLFFRPRNRTSAASTGNELYDELGELFGVPAPTNEGAALKILRKRNAQYTGNLDSLIDVSPQVIGGQVRAQRANNETVTNLLHVIPAILSTLKTHLATVTDLTNRFNTAEKHTADLEREVVRLDALVSRLTAELERFAPHIARSYQNQAKLVTEGRKLMNERVKAAKEDPANADQIRAEAKAEAYKEAATLRSQEKGVVINFPKSDNNNNNRPPKGGAANN